MSNLNKFLEVKKNAGFIASKEGNNNYEKLFEKIESSIEAAGLILIPSVEYIKVINGVKPNSKARLVSDNYTELGVKFTLLDIETSDEIIKTNWYGNAADRNEEVSFDKAFKSAKINFMSYMFNIKINKEKLNNFGHKQTEHKIGSTWRNIESIKPSDHEVKRAIIIGFEHNITEKQIEEAIYNAYGKDSIRDLTIKEYDELCSKLQVKDGLKNLGKN